MANGQVRVEAPEAGGGEPPRVAAGSYRGGSAHGLGAQRFIDDPGDRLGERGRRAIGDEISGVAMIDQRVEAADGTGDDWCAAGSSFERHQAEALAPTRDDDHVGRPVVGRQDVVGLGLDEPHAIVETELVDELVGAFDLTAAVRSAGAADDDQLCVVAVECV